MEAESSSETPFSDYTASCRKRLHFVSSALTTYICKYIHTAKPGYTDIALYDTSSVASDILWYQSIRHC